MHHGTTPLPKTLLLILASALLATTGCALVGSGGAFEEIDWRSGKIIKPVPDAYLEETQRIRYRRSSEKLAVRHINSIDPAQAEIPGELIQLLYNGLARVGTSDNPEAREMGRFTITARNPASAREVLVMADSSAAWVDAWRAGQTETGYEPVDKLIERFNMSLVSFRELSHTLPTVIATLRSDRAINVYAVGRLFEQAHDVSGAHPDAMIGPTDIKVRFYSDRLRYRYRYGWGDCPAGCINEHIWIFDVYRDGSVLFISEEGDALPG